eukprot:906587-Pyramimonas_sp.AAC.1
MRQWGPRGGAIGRRGRELPAYEDFRQNGNAYKHLQRAVLAGRCPSRGASTFRQVRVPSSFECKTCEYKAGGLEDLCSHLAESHLPRSVDANLDSQQSSDEDGRRRGDKASGGSRVDAGPIICRGRPQVPQNRRPQRRHQQARGLHTGAARRL